MTLGDFKKLFEWSVQWSQNIPASKEVTDEEVCLAVDHYMRGVDPWESAAAICEGRSI